MNYLNEQTIKETNILWEVFIYYFVYTNLLIHLKLGIQKKTTAQRYAGKALVHAGSGSAIDTTITSAGVQRCRAFTF